MLVRIVTRHVFVAFAVQLLKHVPERKNVLYCFYSLQYLKNIQVGGSNFLILLDLIIPFW